MSRIRNRIFKQLFIPIVLFYLVIIGGGWINIGNSYRAMAVNQKQAALDNVVRGLDDWLLSRVSEVVQLSRIPLMHNPDEEQIRRYLSQWKDTFSFLYKDIHLISPLGRSWSSSSGETGYFQDDDYIKKFTQDKALLLYKVLDQEYARFGDDFIIGAPVKDKDDQVLYILTASISLDTLQRIFGFFSYEDFDSWMVVNPSSTIISHSDIQFQGKKETWEYGRVFLTDQQWEDQQVFVKIMRNGWKLVAFVEKENLMKAYRQSYSLIGVFSISLFIILIIFVLLLSSTVAKPIKGMTDRVHLIMNGDYKQAVHVNTKDELQELAESFNRLAKRMITLRTDDRFAFLGHISARMAHELRKPLNIIQLSSMSLGSDPGNNEKYRALIDEEISNADKFIREILNFAHDDNLNQVWYGIDVLLGAVVGKYRLVGEQAGVSISLYCEGNFPMLYLDIMKLEEVFSNIIQNGIDSILESESSKKWIRISLSQTRDKEIHIFFNDSGPGFDESLIDRLFDPYFTTRDKGTGIGLSLSYRVLSAHNASISLRNDIDHHGLVKIIFPL